MSVLVRVKHAEAQIVDVEDLEGFDVVVVHHPSSPSSATVDRSKAITIFMVDGSVQNVFFPPTCPFTKVYVVDMDWTDDVHPNGCFDLFCN